MHENSAQRGTWGTVCGHYFWDNNNVGDIVCRQLGYESGDTYTFGHTNQLPNLPVVIAGGLCDGSEANLFGCPVAWTGERIESFMSIILFNLCIHSSVISVLRP